jgi:hypothetical protein
VLVLGLETKEGYTFQTDTKVNWSLDQTDTNQNIFQPDSFSTSINRNSYSNFEDGASGQSDKCKFTTPFLRLANFLLLVKGSHKRYTRVGSSLDHYEMDIRKSRNEKRLSCKGQHTIHLTRNRNKYANLRRTKWSQIESR